MIKITLGNVSTFNFLLLLSVCKGGLSEKMAVQYGSLQVSTQG